MIFSHFLLQRGVNPLELTKGKDHCNKKVLD